MFISENGGTLNIGLLLDYADGRTPVTSQNNIAVQMVDNAGNPVASIGISGISSTYNFYLSIDGDLGAKISVGSYTLSLFNDVDNVIVPRNIEINVVSEAAYQQMFNNSDWQRKENTMITANGFYVRSAAAAIAVRLIDNDLRTVADITNEEMVDGDDTTAFADTLLAVAAKDVAANGFYVELPTWLPPGIYEVEVYEEASPTNTSTITYTQMIDVRK